ncbi:glutamyl aminopeptidase [Calliopsis andreniformis]|uniref:glutamyl aminopeptidase n=1 Tax=Calliopsis andreniformis TaxID=337506 RepID=UPI003FCD82CE
MTDWRFVLITIVLMETEDFSAIAGNLSRNNLGRYRDEPMEIEKRLPEDVVPRNYVIAISPDLQKDEFHGSIRIDIEVLQDRSLIILHSKNLSISSTKLYSQKSQSEIHIKSVHHVNKREMFVIKAFTIFPAGEYALKMNFSGDLRGKITGFYLSTYTDLNQSLRKIAVTQFEPFYARNAFPCFDEPSFKATFTIRILHSEEHPYHALSNMPVAKVESLKNESDSRVTYFAPTPPMSTYLVAFVVSDFECLGSSLKLINGSKIPLNICIRPMYRNKTSFAMEVATKAIEFYLDLFQIDFPLAKLDLVAIPDFAAGAMENWGLITFRETELLHSQNDSSCQNMRSVSLAVAHELAHTWFGNLVTMKWWNDLWLNEGFATYMEHRAVDSVFPQWNQMDYFPLHTKYVSMKHDTKMRARPIVKRVEDPEEIEEMFDRISYQKAAAVIGMLENAIGSSIFFRGIRNYLKEYQFRNADSQELFEMLESSTSGNIDLTDIVSRWTKFPGFPVVNIRQEGSSFRLSQKRFATSKRFKETLDDGSWTIPITYVTSRRDGAKLDWFLANFSCVELPLERSVDWIKLNHKSVGYYIVNYTEEAWNKFRNLLSHNYQTLNAVDRADLLHDAFLLAEAADLCYSVVMNLTSYLVNETAYQPWAVATEWFGLMNRLLDGTDVYPRFQIYARNLIDRIYGQIEWNVSPEKSFADREFGVLILNAACSVAHRHCLETANRKLRDFLHSDGREALPTDIRSIVYSFGLVTQLDDVGSIFENMSRLLARESDAQERERLIIGLTSIQDKDTLNRYLERATNENFVRKQDFADVLIKIATNPIGLDIAWNFVRSRWDSLVRKYAANGFTLGKTVVAIVSLFKDYPRIQEARMFFLEHPELKVTESTKRNAMEEMENSINWLNTNLGKIDEWLKDNGFD